MADRVHFTYRRLSRDTSGAIAIHLALMLLAIMGFAGLGTEVTFLLRMHRAMQMTADAAALGAATAMQTGHPANPTLEAEAAAGAAGFVNGVGSTTITVDIPPTDGPRAGKSNVVEVIVDQPQTLAILSLFGPAKLDVGARAVAIPGTGSYCVLQLASISTTGVTMSNGAVANLTQCGLAADATGTTALSMSGAAQLNAQSVSVVGEASVSNGATINPSGALKTSQGNVADPYASVVMPSFSGCAEGNNKSYGHGTWSLSPGVYCNGIALTNDAIVTMATGVYFVDRGSFNVGGSVKLTGTSVMIVLTSSTGSGYATLSITNGATITLTAPTSGANAGIIFFGDRRAPLSNSNSFQGGTTINLNGAVYVPTQSLIFQNGASNPSGCTQLIAGTIQLIGGSAFQNNCPTGVVAIGGTSSSLVE